MKLAHRSLANTPSFLFSFLLLASKSSILQRQLSEEGREGEGGIRREKSGIHHHHSRRKADPLCPGERNKYHCLAGH